MKKLIIKNIALGMFLAGFTVSNAFALDAKTTKPIEGNPPLIKGTSANAKDHSLTLTVEDSAGNTIGQTQAKVGNYIKIKYNLQDTDGDEDKGSVKTTLKVFYLLGNTWKEANMSTLELSGTNNASENEIKFKITDEFAGATKIGFKILERTEFGLPYANQWLRVSDIWSNKAPGTVNGIDENGNLTGGPIPSDLDGKDEGPGDVDNPNLNGFGPIASDEMKVYILAADSNDNYSIASSTLVPKQGGKYKAVVWLDKNGNGILDANDVDLSANYNFKWSLDGNYESVPASADVIASTQVITLGQLNSDSMYASGNYKAGAQGYNLKVTAEIKP
ncbi:hypothetical protein [Gilliamella sp. G0441]|uniref:hypothetical protein n=1 Tax=Gilliamella sp. G0441 TaxID=3384760 RepID=UPI003D338FAE